MKRKPISAERKQRSKYRVLIPGLLVLFISFAVTALPSLAQDSQQGRTITGSVSDANGEAMIGVTVMIQGTTTGTITDVNGNYSLTVPEGTEILEFRFIGMQTKEESIGSRTIISVVMEEESITMEEVVVVGYGVQEKESLVSAIDQVAGERIQGMGVTNVSAALSGVSPGLVSVSNSGQPGADDAELYIRGRSSVNNDQALVVVDGVEQLSDFSYMDPDEIASISVLKDAAATAVYGVKGANGVIIINTNRGREGKAKLSFSSNFTLKAPATPVDLEGSANTLSLFNIASMNDNAYSQLISDETLQKYRDQNEPYLYPDIDWYDALVRDVSFAQKHNFSARGGTEFVKYFMSLGYVHEGDAFVPSDDLGLGYNSQNSLDNIIYRLNLDFNITKTTTFRTDFAGRQETQKESRDLNFTGDIYEYPPWATPLYYPGSILEQYPDDNPVHPGEDLPRFAFNDRIQNANNPYTYLHGRGEETRRRNVLTGNFELNQELDFITEGLSAQGRFNMSSNYQYLQEYRPNLVEFFLHADSTWQNVSGVDEQMEKATTRNESNTTKQDQFYYSASLNYNRMFGRHAVTALGLWSRNIRRAGSNFPDYKEDWVGRLTYNYGKRYFLEGSGAYNGTDKFADGKRFGFFPAVAVGWNLANEPFIQNNVSFLNQFKIRYSYGQSGSEAGSSKLMYLGTYEVYDTKTDLMMKFGDEFQDQGGYIEQTLLSNPNATWETATKENVGLDFSVFNNLFSGSVDFFREYREGIFLTPQNIPPYYGSTADFREYNLGETEKQGYEIVLQHSYAPSSDFNYFVKFTYGFNNNRRGYMGEPANLEDYQKQEGKPLGTSQLMINTRYYANIDEVLNYVTPSFGGSWSPGDLMYVDYNCDGQVDDAYDAIYHGYPQAQLHQFGLTLGANYKKWNLRAFVTATEGVDQMARGFYLPFHKERASQVRPEHFDYWTPDNPNAAFPTHHFTSVAYENNTQSNTFNQLDASYIRLKNVELSYNLIPKKPFIGIDNIRFNFTGYNLLTWTEVIYGDPEGRNAGNYPILRRFNLGVKIDF